MKKFMFLMLALIVGFSASAQSLPDVKIENQEGKVISTKSLVDGTPMIISFWSTTCKPCIMELNAVNDNLYDWLEEVNMKVVAVSVDDARTVSRARAMTKGQGWDDYVCLYDKNQDFLCGARTCCHHLTHQGLLLCCVGDEETTCGLLLCGIGLNQYAI